MKTKTKISIAILIVLIATIVIFKFNYIDRTILDLSSSEVKLVNDYLALDAKHKVSIASENEPGNRLILCLTFLNKDNNKPVSSNRIMFYHTSSSGEYSPKDTNDESTARLNGEAITNEDGRIFVETILPGDYGSSSDNRHIHTIVFGAKPEGYDIHFKQFTGFMGESFVEGSDQHFLADLKYTEDSTMVSFLKIYVKNPT